MITEITKGIVGGIAGICVFVVPPLAYSWALNAGWLQRSENSQTYADTPIDISISTYDAALIIWLVVVATVSISTCVAFARAANHKNI